MDIREDAARYIAWLRDVRNFSAATQRSYRSTLVQLGIWLEQVGLDADDLTLAELEAFINRPRRRGDMVGRPATLARDIATLKSFYAWAERDGVAKDVAADLYAPTIHNVAPKPIPDDEWMKLWALPALTRTERVWLGLGFYCGLRRNELANVKVHHVSLQGRKLVSFVRKGGGDHTVPIGSMLDVFASKLPHIYIPEMWDLIADTAGGREPSELLAKVKDPGHLARQMHKMCDAASIQHHTPHSLRHSTATNLLRANVPLHLVSRLMNHTNVTTTMRYVRAGGDELDEWLNR